VKKTALVLISITLAFGLLAVAGNTLLARALNASLPGLLEKQLGLDVGLAPLELSLRHLQASSPELVLGNADSPALRATHLTLSLSFPDLLKGKLRLKSVSGDSLQLAMWRWPDSGEQPAAANYLWLRDWLPGEISVQRLEIAAEPPETSIALHALTLQLQDEGATAGARLQNGSAGIGLRVALASLDELLALRATHFELQTRVAGRPDTLATAQVAISSDENRGYALDAALDAPGIAAQIEASAGNPWKLPTHSNTRISTLKAREIQALLGAYLPRSEGTPLLQWLDSPVPALTLPKHAGRVRIEQAQWAGRTFSNTALRIVTHANGLTIEKFTSNAPGALLHGDMTLSSHTDGWSASLAATLEAQDTGSEAGSQPDAPAGPGSLHANWAMHSGSLELTATGASWRALLYSLAGNVTAAGSLSADAEASGHGAIPIELTGQLDNSAEAFALEQLAVELGDGTLTGNIRVAGTRHRSIDVELQANDLDLSFLASPEPEAANAPPTSVSPAWLSDTLSALSGVDVNASIDIANLLAPGLALAQAQVLLTHQGSDDDTGETVLEAKARDNSGGVYQLGATAKDPTGNNLDASLRVDLTKADLAALLRQPGLPHSRVSGTLLAGTELPDTPGAPDTISGSAELTMALRADNNWLRPPLSGESLNIAADTEITLDRQRLDELYLNNVQVTGDALDISGTLSLIEDRTPRLKASLETPHLDIDTLRTLLPQKNEEEADSEDPLQRLRESGSAELSVTAGKVTLGANTLNSMRLEVATREDRIELRSLDFEGDSGKLTGSGSIVWQGEKAILGGSARLTNVNLDQYLLEYTDEAAVPVSGSVQFESAGRSQRELLGNLSGQANLSATDDTQNVDARARRSVKIQAKRLPDGVQLEMRELVWGDTDLSGEVEYRRGTPDTWRVDIKGGTLSLAPWEDSPAAKANSAGKSAGSAIAGVARTSAGFLGNLLASPLRMLADATPTRAGERVFSPEALPLETLDNLDLIITGKLSQLQSSVIRASDITFSARVENSKLSASASSGAMQDGEAALTLAFDAVQPTPTLEFESTFNGVKGLTGDTSFPRSGFVSLTSTGASVAELAANSSGILYLELGSGPFDFSGIGPLSADIATGILKTLLPGMEAEKSRLDCGIALFQAEDGLVATPYGIVARTNQANLVGRAQIDLRDETLHAQMDSRSREGLGLSVGSLFSNTVQVRGPLSEPRLEPNASSILWRGWAAVMTGGLSMLGESMLKRALASDDPCVRMQALIQEQLCPNNALAASSTLVCPQGSDAIRARRR